MIIEKRNKILFINLLMKKGKKHQGEKLLLKCVKKNQKESNKVFLELFCIAVKNTIVSFKSENLKKKRNIPKTTLIFLIGEKNRKMRAMKEIYYATQHKSFTTNQNHIKLENKILFVLTEFINAKESYSSVLGIHETLISQKKYASKFKWG